MDATLFIRRPVLSIVLSLVITLLGAVAFTLLPVRETPDVSAPVVTVQTVWPGADPALMETQVTEVLEKQLNGIEGVRQITSQSQDQNSSITVEFELGRDLEAAANDVRSRVSRARRNLPDEVDEPVVEKADAAAQPVMFLRLASKTRSLLELNELGDTLVRERLQSATGVSGVDIFGEQRFAMRVELDPAKLAARRLTTADIEAAFRAQNVDIPAGRVEGTFVDLGIRLDGGFRTPEEFAAMLVADTGDGQVRLGDVATVRVGAAQERQAARADGQGAVTLAITPQANANIVELSDAVRARLPQVQADLPPDVELVEQYDRADAVRTSIEDVEKTLLIAFGLVVAVIFAFLRDLRSTLVPTLAIPVSIVGTFFALWVLGFSVNVFTLFGLVLAIGLVVDDAIVVLENVYRLIEGGMPPKEAASRGTQQIQFAVIATTLSLVAVFLPVIFTGGTSGRLFLEFGTTVAVSVAISAVVALTLTPTLCAALLRAHHGTRGPLWRLSEWLLQGLNRVFIGSLAVVLRRRWVVAPLVLGSLAAGVYGYQVLPREFFPLEDRNIFFVRLVAPEGTTFEYLDERMKALEPKLMDAVPERRALLTRVSQGTGGSVAVGNIGTFVFPLVPADERERSQQEIVDAVRKIFATETAFNAIPVQFPTVGRSFNSPVQIVVQHPDFEQLSSTLPKLVGAMRQVPGLTAVNEDLKLNRPELRAEVDREKAANAGLGVRELARTLQIASSGLDVSDYKRGTRQYDVILGLPRALRDTPSGVLAMPVRSRDGSMAPLGNFVRFTERSAASSRYHFDRSPSATISANLDGIPLGEGIERARAAVTPELGEGFRLALAGESRDFADASSALFATFGLALLLVYLTLAAQFDSFVDPFSILLSVPLALTGAFAGLAVLGMSLSFFAQVGLILLVGLVTKNGILIVEYAHQLMRDEGLPLWAAAERATQLRFRPILMTSIATIGGALPIAIGFSGSSRSPLGVAVVAGMALATVLTLYVVPVAWGTFARKGGGHVAGAGAAVLLLLLGVPRAEAAEPAEDTAGAADTAERPAGAAWGGGVLSLEEALALALRRNPDVSVSETLLRRAEAGVAAARAGLLPTVGAEATALAGVDAGSGLGGDGAIGAVASASLSAHTPVVDLAAAGELRAARADALATSASVDLAVEQTLAGVAARYVALQAAEARLASAEAGVRRADELLELARERQRVGMGLAIDVTRAELQFRRAESARATARTGVTAARMELAATLGLEPAAPLVVAPAAPALAVEQLPDVAALEEALRTSTPLLRQAEAELDAAEAGRVATARRSAPSLTAFGETGVAWVGVASPAATAGLSLDVPIFAGGAVRAGVDAARAQEEGLRVALEDTQRRNEAALRLAFGRMTDAAEAWQAAVAARELSTLEVEQATARWRAGAAAHTEVVEAQVREVQVREEEIAALSTYNLAVTGWLAARGELRGLAKGG